MKFVTNFTFTFKAAQGVDTNVVTAMMVSSTFIILCKNDTKVIVKHSTTDSMHSLLRLHNYVQSNFQLPLHVFHFLRLLFLP